MVIDTNIVLDLWGFNDPATHALRDALVATVALDRIENSQSVVAAPASLKWIATAAMRAELCCVVSRPHLQQAFAAHGGDHQAVIDAFDLLARLVAEPAAQPVTNAIRCTDADDQKFIDLALAHCCPLLSKDRAVLKLRKRLSKRGVDVDSRWISREAVENH